MAVLTEDRKSERKQGIIFALPVAASAHIYAGAMVSVNSAGYLVPASDTTAEKFLGVAKKESDNSTGVAGAIAGEGYMVGLFEMNASGLTQVDLAKDAYVVDDNNVGEGIVAQPVNVTGITVARTPLSSGGTKALAFTFAGTLLAYGGGAGVNVGTDGTYTLTAPDGSTVEVTSVAASLPGADASDNIQLRHVKAGRVVEVVSATSVFIDISGSQRS